MSLSSTRHESLPTRFGPGARQIYGTGEMASLTRSFDWGKTMLGPIESWPDILLGTVNLVLGSAHPMFLWWGEDLIQFYNDGYRTSIGLDKHPSALGQPGRACWGEIWELIWPQIEGVLKRGETTWNENRLVPIYRDGVLTDVYWTYGYSPVRDVDGTVRGVLVVCSETTAQVRAAAAMRDERARLLDVLKQAPMFFTLLTGPEHTISMVNPLYMKLINYRDVLGKTVREALPEAAEQGFVEILDQVYAGEPYRAHEMRYDAYAGEGEPLESRYLDFIYEPLREVDGSISGIITLGVDVTARKVAQDLLIKTEKLAAVGRLAASIAHEINNPLEAVTNLLYLARREDDPEQIRDHLAMAERELRRVSAITNQTLSFHRQSSAPREITCLELFTEVLQIYQGKLVNSNVTIEKRKRAQKAVRCFEGEVRQVLSNLLGNAIDSMRPDGGRLLLRSRDGTDWRTGRKGLVLTVADEGSGISHATMERLFEPFFTTKGLSGSGLGLWVSHEIMERHHGRLLVRSRVRDASCGKGGTVFAMFLPFDAEAETKQIAA
jgi:signal transduction histidine kinase